jgi:preprotein translocase subunit SecD
VAVSKPLAVVFLLLLSVSAPAGEEVKHLIYLVDPAMVFRAAEVVRARLAALGAERDIAISAFTSKGLMMVEVPAARATELRGVIERPGRLEMLVVAMPPEASEGDPGRETEERAKRTEERAAYAGPPAGFRWVPVRGGGGADRLVEVPPDGGFTGADIDLASVRVHSPPFTADHIVEFKLRGERAGAFGDFTGKIVKRRLAMVIDDKIESSPVVQERLPRGAAISGGGPTGFTEAEARCLAAILAGGELPCVLRTID